MDLKVKYNGKDVGILNDDTVEILFEYDPDFIDAGIEISPFKLPLGPGLKSHNSDAFSGLPGVFSDSLPDHYGERVLQAAFAKEGLVGSPTPLEKLSYVGSRGMGALTYEPELWSENESARVDIVKLSHDARIVEREISFTECSDDFLRSACSPGGAQPKVVAGFNPKSPDSIILGGGPLPEGFSPWLIKINTAIEGFSRDSDRHQLEYAYSLMVKEAGIEMADCHLIKSVTGERTISHFATKRFDRDGEKRFHIHTYAGLSHKDFNGEIYSYYDLLEDTKILTSSMVEVEKVFRRMIFNILSGNHDDHLKNHSFILKDNEWSVSPVYDITCVKSKRGGHCMSVGNAYRNITQSNVIELGKQCDVSERKAKTIIDEVSSAISKFQSFAKQAGVSKQWTDYVESVICDCSSIFKTRKKSPKIRSWGDILKKRGKSK